MLDSKDESILNYNIYIYMGMFPYKPSIALGYFSRTPPAQLCAPGHKGSTGTAGDSPAAESKPAAWMAWHRLWRPATCLWQPVLSSGLYLPWIAMNSLTLIDINWHELPMNYLWITMNYHEFPWIHWHENCESSCHPQERKPNTDL